MENQSPTSRRLWPMDRLPKLNPERAWALTTQCPAYQATPLIEINSPMGAKLLIKDETNRFSLGAFKALGGIYAIAIFLLEEWQRQRGNSLQPDRLFEQELQTWSEQFIFVCASAGNHGMAVAKGAQLFNARSRIYLSETVPESFAEKLRALNAEVIRSGATYEDSMSAASDYCHQGDEMRILLADSSWPGYTAMPILVMEGYTVMAEEMRREFVAGNNWPSHVLLQAGVGGLAAAIAYHIRKSWEVQPEIIVVEPDAAPCLKESMKRGELTTVEGPVSAMGRLDCKEASMLAFDILRQYGDQFVCVSDNDALVTVDFLKSQTIVTTESGAAGVASILSPITSGLALPEDAVCLAIVSEGQV